MIQQSLLPKKITGSRKLITKSLLCGMGCGFLCIIIALLVIRHQRNVEFDRLATATSHYFVDYFNQISASSEAVAPLLGSRCDNAFPQMTMKATFDLKVRTLVLVKNGVGYCSSGTGNTLFALKQYVPELDTSKPYDITLLPGTLKMPHQPSIVLWFGRKNMPGNGVMTTLNLNLDAWLLEQLLPRKETELALLIKGHALTTFDNKLINVDALPRRFERSVTLSKYGITLRIYSAGWSDNEIWFTVLGTLATSIIVSLICAWFMVASRRPGRDIQNAIRRNHFWVAYQPVIDTKTGSIGGVEALMRWEHPSAGPISPDIFIAAAEAQHMIIPLTQHLFHLIGRDIPHLMEALPRGAKIGVNLAPSHLYSPSFKQDILEFTSAFPTDHFQIVFEITERDMLKEREAIELFHWLHSEGFEIAVDDFGTGHSALIYLERFTLDYLKIDRGFIHTIGVETVTSPVLDAVLTLAQRLGMSTVAEGVETEQQAQWLTARGVKYLQGYLYARPLSATALIAWSQKQAQRDDKRP